MAWSGFYDPERRRTIEQRLYEFFEKNRHEELSVEDAMEKFNAGPSTVRTALGSMTTSGVLEKTTVYRWRRTP